MEARVQFARGPVAHVYTVSNGFKKQQDCIREKIDAHKLCMKEAFEIRE